MIKKLHNILSYKPTPELPIGLGYFGLLCTGVAAIAVYLKVTNQGS